MKVDNNILKLDTVDPIYINKVDRPVGHYDVAEVIRGIASFRGHAIVQTMFMKGKGVDNTGEAFVGPWLEALLTIKPSQVMIYTIDRETPDKTLLKATREELEAICERVKALGIDCSAS